MLARHGSIRHAGGLVARQRDSGSPWSAASGVAKPLTGQVAWVVGGAGITGRAICLGLLQAGATVIMNSRATDRLTQLQQEFNHPEQLICITGSLRPDSAEETVKKVMDMTNGRLNHVIAHNGVRWWPASHHPSLHAISLDPPDPFAIGNEMNPEMFAYKASVATALHYAAAQQLLPFLRKNVNPSYTFLTGGASGSSLETKVNAYATQGLASGLRQAYKNSEVRINELRTRFHEVAEKDQAQETEPQGADILWTLALLAELGEICAGMAAADSSGGLYSVHNSEDVSLLKCQFPFEVVVKDLPLLFTTSAPREPRFAGSP
eukprot:TRINITY_DN19287_c2_g1_i1.p1 TRINITY_DN19287_c2_g1~~TRINITY_DN19287_c2_g1_i1.p1  ORF type:complete len:354 (+),score=42.13 TRINITY_DN19287_c2_g1_i1:100-1062(+)